MKEPRKFWIQKGTPDLICDSWKEAESCQTEHREDLPWIHVREVQHSQSQSAGEKAMQCMSCMEVYRETSSEHVCKPAEASPTKPELFLDLLLDMKKQDIERKDTRIRELEAQLFKFQSSNSDWVRAENYLGRIKELEAALGEIDKTLRIPAAEYVPAIGDVFTIIDQALGHGGGSE